jgi:hypothetical protein
MKPEQVAVVQRGREEPGVVTQVQLRRLQVSIESISMGPDSICAYSDGVEAGRIFRKPCEVGIWG